MGQQLREIGSSAAMPQEPAISLSGNRNGTEFMRSVYNGMNHDQRQQAKKQVQIQTPGSDIVPGQDEQANAASSSKYLWTADEVVESQPSISFDDLIAWTANYFDNWHPAFPFVNAPLMLQDFQSISEAGLGHIQKDPLQLTILRALVSMSIEDRRQTGVRMTPAPASILFLNFHDSMGAVGDVLHQESSIKSLQALLSIQLLLVTMLRYNAASRLGGLTVRIAYQLGLHRCPAHLSTAMPKESDMRQRIFWSIYCLDRHICPRLGLPLAIRDDDIDVCYPGHEKHRDSPQASKERNGQLDLLVLLARNARIRGSVMELRNRSMLKDTASSELLAMTTNTELTRWWNDVEEYLETSDSMDVPLSAAHRLTLSMLRHESVIALNRSLLASSNEHRVYNSGLQNCISASRAVINTLHEALQVGTPLLWPSFTWAVWVSTFILVHGAEEDQLTKDVAIRFVGKAIQVLEHLARRGSSWPEACIAAIRGLRTQLIEDHNRSKASLESRAATGGPAPEPIPPSMRKSHARPSDGIQTGRNDYPLKQDPSNNSCCTAGR